MATIKTPVEGVTGEIAGVKFSDGVGHTDDQNAINFFIRRGYDVSDTPKTTHPASGSIEGSADPEVDDQEPEENLDGEDTRTVKELKDELRARDLPVSGTREELLERLGGEA